MFRSLHRKKGHEASLAEHLLGQKNVTCGVLAIVLGIRNAYEILTGKVNLCVNTQMLKLILVEDKP